MFAANGVVTAWHVVHPRLEVGDSSRPLGEPLPRRREMSGGRPAYCRGACVLSAWTGAPSSSSMLQAASMSGAANPSVKPA
jgi:hypothetical protein